MNRRGQGPVLVPTLKAAVERAAGRPIAPDYDLGAVARREAARLEPGRHALRGLFCGGTLATEAHAVLAAAGLAVGSNAAPSAKARHGRARPRHSTARGRSRLARTSRPGPAR